MEGRQEHWETIHTQKDPTRVSWYQPHLERSLEMIGRFAPSVGTRIIDIGGGASTLVDDLLSKGYQAICVLDISEKALERIQARLGERAATIEWRVGDITTIQLPEHQYDLWHDRAVFHFLVDSQDRQKYVSQLRSSLKSGSIALLSTFSLNGPEKCSGLPVRRYDAASLQTELGDEFELVNSGTELHHTPFDTQQEFIYCAFRYHPNTGS